MIRLIHHADGVLCPVTLAMHLAAAIETRDEGPAARACVVVAGGREPPHWEAYPQHQYISTVGSLSCCAEGGCWKSRCQLVGDGDDKDRRNVCEQPVEVQADLRIPRCMEMITPQEVIDRIERYYAGGVLRYLDGPARAADAGPRRAAANQAGQLPAANGKPPAAANRKPVLINFRHGLGDAAQFTIVLRHLARHRPQWNVDVFSLQGKHTAFTGLANRCWHDRDRNPNRANYKQVFDIDWHEAERAYERTPSTKVTRCLVEELKIDPDPSLYHYRIEQTPSAAEGARGYLESISGAPGTDGRYPVLLLHYQGNTSQQEKDLTHEQARGICDAAVTVGLTPVVLDWDRRSPLPDDKTIFCPPLGRGDIWGDSGTGDAAVLAALIESSALMIGVDSGPLHVAGATTTPTLAVWTGHFPAQYFDLADNVKHFVPQHWTGVGLARRKAAQRYFQENYSFAVYDDLLRTVRDEILSRSGMADDDGLVRSGEFWIRRDNIEQDLVIVRDIYEEDAYRTHLLSDNAGPQVVVDIGAHIGCFAKLWHRKNPEARIICVEACPENLEALRRNVGDFAEVVPAACTYESEPIALLNAVRPNCESTGGSVVVPKAELETSDLRQGGYQYWHDLRELAKVDLEELMSRMGVDRIDILKLDCEGSEYSILGKTPSLDRIRFILGEYHGRRRWDDFRRKRLADWDYGHMYDGGENGGLFHYANPDRPAAAAGTPTVSATPTAGLQAQWPELLTPNLLRVAVPAGIGDSVWALTKIPAVLQTYGAEKAHVALCGGPPHRAKEFVERFDFVESASYSNWECVESERYTPEGVYNWAPSGVGWHGEFDYMLQANRHLESGGRLESWLPEFETDWKVADRFHFTGGEVREARELDRRVGSYCVFYFGPEKGNTESGHNRGPLWTPEDWSELAQRCRSMGLAIVAVGAEYDRSYFERQIAPVVGPCEDAIGRWGIGRTFAVIQRARFVVAYQSGIGVFAAYMGVPTAMFWRPHGDSIDPGGYVSFQEKMAAAWAPRQALEQGAYLPSIYTKCSPESIADHAVRHDW